jgi:hypothetical protein
LFVLANNLWIRWWATAIEGMAQGGAEPLSGGFLNRGEILRIGLGLNASVP